MIQKISKKRARWGTLNQYKKICLEIWEERERTCEDCGAYIYEPKYHNFNHTEGRTKNFLNKNCIQLLCFVCHSKYEGIKVKNGEWVN